jgi:hypothetical protein
MLEELDGLESLWREVNGDVADMTLLDRFFVKSGPEDDLVFSGLIPADDEADGEDFVIERLSRFDPLPLLLVCSVNF